MKSVKINPFYLLSIFIVLVLTLPGLVSEGMFMDAMLYTSVSKNLANDYGTFWLPQFSDYNVGDLTSFHEQPPLVFGMQALFFKVFGNGWFTERLYVLFTILVNYILIILIWKKLAKKQLNKLAWFAPILWISIPVCFWSYSNNMHENTMSFFCLLAVFFFILHKKNNRYFVWLILTVSAIFASSLSKGLPGLFPLSVPILYAIFLEKKWMKAIGETFFLLLGVVGLYFAFILFIPEAKEGLRMYFFERALKRIGEEVSHTVDSRFYIFYRLASELIVPVLVGLIVYFLGKRNVVKIDRRNVLLAGFFITVGLSGSLPLFLTKVQKGFYFVASLPFFGLGISFLFSNYLLVLVNRIKTTTLVRLKVVFIIPIVALLLFCSFTYREYYVRDKEILEDVYYLGSILPPNERIGSTGAVRLDWSMLTYMVRYNSMHCVKENDKHRYFLSKKNDVAGYVLMEKLNTFNLFEKISL